MSVDSTDRLLLAHDLGTSGNKATLFSESGELIGSVTVSYETHFSGVRAEQAPEEWWSAVCKSTRQLTDGIELSRIACVAFSGQMQGCLPVDSRGNPLSNHILYCDFRAEEQIKELCTRLDPLKIYEITGHRASSAYSLAKLMWIRDNQPEIFSQTVAMLNAKDYINFRLTGRIATDYNDASGTNAFDLAKFSWSEEILDKAGIDPRLFPEVLPSPTIIGEVTPEAAAETGLRAGTPVAVGAGDGGCATVGAGSVAPGRCYNYLGSSSWISTTSKERFSDPEMVTFTWAHPVPGYVQPCGTMQTAGTAYSWVKEQLGWHEREVANDSGISPYVELNRLIETSPPGARGVMFLPYLLGERSPRWNPDAKGAFLGITQNHRREDIFRSVLEGIAYNLDVTMRIFRRSTQIDEVLLIGGGARGEVWRSILANVYGVRVAVPTHLEEATSMGAAVIGGVASGVFSDFTAVDRFIRVEKRVDPVESHMKIYEGNKKLFDDLYTALEPLFPRMGGDLG